MQSVCHAIVLPSDVWLIPSVEISVEQMDVPICSRSAEISYFHMLPARRDVYRKSIDYLFNWLRSHREYIFHFVTGT